MNKIGLQVETEIFDLLVSMEATDRQLDFPIIYASAKQGRVNKTLLLDIIRESPRSGLGRVPLYRWAVDDMKDDKTKAGMTALLRKVPETRPFGSPRKVPETRH